MTLLHRRRWLLFVLLAVFALGCGKDSGSDDGVVPPPTPPAPPPPPPPVAVMEMDSWLTRGNMSALLQKQPVLQFGTATNSNTTIEVDSTRTYQDIDGFGFTLTQGSAYLISRMSAADRAALLEELFGNGSGSIGISYLRVGIGATDLSTELYSYNDKPAGETDPTLSGFSLAHDEADVIPVLKQILAINPAIKVLATPWSAPAWMKDNGSTKGGSLKPEYYDAYARYFVKYIQGMAAKGITVTAVTPQNEPLNAFNNPSMVMTAAQQAEFIKTNLGPAFRAASLNTKIIIYDHNADQISYPLAVLGDAGAAQYIDGSAFHLYGGEIQALSQVHNAFPTKNIYFTEQYTASNGSFAGDLKWHLRNVVIGSVRNWSKVVLEWNLANDASVGPFIPGTCNTCLGAVTIGHSITRNVGYYIIAHAAKFVPAGSKRIESTASTTSLHNVAFLRPDGRKVLIVLNEAAVSQTFTIKFKDRWVVTTLAAESVGTYTW